MDKMMETWLEEYLQEPIRQKEAIHTGWDHDVYVLNDSWVLRVPKKGVTITLEEEKLLKDLQVKTNIVLPAITICPTPEGKKAMLYPYIPGHPITSNISDIFLEIAANQLGTFLTKLHQLDASSYKLPKRDKSYYNLLLERTRRFYSNLPYAVIDYTEELFTELQPETSAVVHGDLSTAHILWEESSCQVGIIDFSDMHIGDPAIDFVGISQISLDFLRQVLSKYEAADKEAIKQRANQLAQLELYFELIKYGPSSKLIDEMERRFVKGKEA